MQGWFVRARNKRWKNPNEVSLPEDIILEVLLRLWRAVISDTTFVAVQRSHGGPHLVGVFFEGCCPTEVRLMDMDGNVVRVFQVKDMDNHNALGTLQQAAMRLNNVIVRGECTGNSANANPIIIDLCAGHACIVDVHRAAPSDALVTFGRAALSGAFKVMYMEECLRSKICTIVDDGTGGPPSSGTKRRFGAPLRWRRTSAQPFVTSWWPKRRVTINGVVYCLPPPFDQYGAASSGSHHIAAFDLENEEWTTIKGPAQGIREKTLSAKLIELKGTLGFVQFLCRQQNEHYYDIIIWLLIDLNKSVWVKEYTIQMPSTWELVQLLGTLDDGRVLLLVREQTKQNKAGYHTRHINVFYNPVIKTFTKFVDIAMGLNDDILVLYTGSLLC